MVTPGVANPGVAATDRDKRERDDLSHGCLFPLHRDPAFLPPDQIDVRDRQDKRMALTAAANDPFICIEAAAVDLKAISVAAASLCIGISPHGPAHSTGGMLRVEYFVIGSRNLLDRLGQALGICCPGTLATLAFAHSSVGPE